MKSVVNREKGNNQYLDLFKYKSMSISRLLVLLKNLSSFSFSFRSQIFYKVLNYYNKKRSQILHYEKKKQQLLFVTNIS